MSAKRVVIVGGGFAGVETARALEKTLPAGWEVWLYSRENHLVFTPLLADVVGSSIDPLHVVWPIREMARGCHCRTANVVGIDEGAKEIIYEDSRGEAQRTGYDHLVLACGIPVRMDIVPGMATHGWPLKTLGDAIILRNRAIGQLERAEIEPDAAARRRMLSFAVVGGGFTGVEIAGALLDLLKESSRFYDRVSANDIRIVLVEGGARILGPLDESLALKADAKMRRRGLEIHTGVTVDSVSQRGVHLGTGELLEADTVISAVGNSIQALVSTSGVPVERNRIKVGPDMLVEGRDDIWAAGDCAAVPNAFDGGVSPTLAQFAVRQAKQLAGNISARIAGRATAPFHHHMQGMFAAIGHNDAVGQIFNFHVSGLPAYILWRGIYWLKMPSFARKVQVAFDWTWDLFFARDIVELQTLQTPRIGRSHYAAGEEIYHQGERGNLIYVVEKGSVEIFRGDDSKPERVLGPGEHFGEDAILHSRARTTTARAGEDLELVVVNEETLSSLRDTVHVLLDEIDKRK